jgi:hypothetical protein
MCRDEGRCKLPVPVFSAANATTIGAPWQIREAGKRNDLVLISRSIPFHAAVRRKSTQNISL